MRLDSPTLFFRACLVAMLLAVPAPSDAERDRAPGFFEQSLDLPGIPAAVISTDMDGDGRDDLVVLVAYTTWDTVSRTEQLRFDDIEGLVEVMSVVSALLDRRELRLYRALASGGFDSRPLTLNLDTSVHALEAGHPTQPVIALTDDGVAAVRLVSSAAGEALQLVPLLPAVTSLAGSGTFRSDLRLLHDLDGDSRTDIVLPTPTGWSIHRGTDEGFGGEPTAVLAAPPEKVDDDRGHQLAIGVKSDTEPAARTQGDEGGEPDSDTDDLVAENGDSGGEQPHRTRVPEPRDVDGDGRLDLLLPVGRRTGTVVYLQHGDLVFSAAVELKLPAGAAASEEITFVGDLDGDAAAEVVSQAEIEPPDDAGFRQEIDAAKRPRFTYRLYHLGTDLRLAGQPYGTFEAVGYVFEGSDHHDDEVDVRLPGGFKDLDGDGRKDLVAITLDFSLFPLILRALIIQAISLRMDFHPWCQAEDGSFTEVPDLDLSGKFHINFRKVRIRHLSQFAGDFNGDGRQDFVQLGRGKKVTIHQGGPQCTYPQRPDRQLRFERQPRHLGLVRILDLDGNGRSDIYVVHPLRDPDTGESIPVRLDLYLSEPLNPPTP